MRVEGTERPRTGPAGTSASRRPASRSGPPILALQRSAGNRAVAQVVASGQPLAVQRIRLPWKTRQAAQPAEEPEQTWEGESLGDYHNTMYRVSRGKIEAVVRRVDRRGKPYYEAVGEVTSFLPNGRPYVDKHDTPKHLGAWTPTITHLSGMSATPEAATNAADAILHQVQASVARDPDLTIAPGDLDVLVTYRARRGFLADLWESLMGKARRKDSVTKTQEQLMLDAVAAKKRLHITAFSQGTIKTDNAVRNAYRALVQRYYRSESRKKEIREEAEKWAKELSATGLMDKDTAYEAAKRRCAERSAGLRARTNMDRYIQLVYAGNAVSYPSSVLPVEMHVGRSDIVSMFAGSFTNRGAKLASGNAGTTVTKLDGGHENDEYYTALGNSVAADLTRAARSVPET